MDISPKKTAAFMALLAVVIAWFVHYAERNVQKTTPPTENTRPANFVVLKVGGFRAEIQWND